jgi:outer membrane protein TolC
VVVDKVLLQQPSVRSAQALLRAAEAQITQVRSDFLPSLGLSYRNSDARDETQGRPVDRNVRRSDASLRWNVFNGAADTHRLRAAGFTGTPPMPTWTASLSRSPSRSPKPMPTWCACVRR